MTITPRRVLLTLSKEYKGNWSKIYEHIREKKGLPEKIADDENAVTVLDECYPNSLKSVQRPPFVLFYEGNFERLNENGFVYLEGGNEIGFDEKKLIRVDETNRIHVGTDLVVWTGSNSSSEASNIGIGLADCLAITKEIKFGTAKNLFVVGMALNYGKDVYVKPTEGKSANNELIKEGAFLLDCKEDIEEESEKN